MGGLLNSLADGGRRVPPPRRKLRFQPLPAEVPVSFRVVELPVAHHLCKVKSLNKGDANSEVTVYYQVPFALITGGGAK